MRDEETWAGFVLFIKKTAQRKHFRGVLCSEGGYVVLARGGAYDRTMVSNPLKLVEVRKGSGLAKKRAGKWK